MIAGAVSSAWEPACATAGALYGKQALPKMKHQLQAQEDSMLLLLLEALGALLLLVFIVWWTMFSGRRNGEASGKDESGAGPGQSADEPRD